MKKIMILICSGIILALAVGLLIFLKYQPRTAVQEVEKKSEAKTASTSAPELTNTCSTNSQHLTLAEIDAVKIDKSDWQTYINKQYGFKISAPKDWTIKLTNSKGELLNHNGSLQISPRSSGDFDIPVDLSA
ncbi:MAG TPA: hypothetical protein VMC41_00975, partial [Candidatus Nanoarchaeia archaeon]|nr:hypothetical protein [Candidatus Nanoarchaeia archaeon]